MTPEDKLTELGLTLPAAPAPGGNYVSAKRVGQLVYLAGVVSTNASGVISGTVGIDRTIEDGYNAARARALTQLGRPQARIRSLDASQDEIISLTGYVNAVPGFENSPAVLNGASDLLVQVFGNAGKHVRAAVGVSALPRNATVELQMTVYTGSAPTSA